jgi:hypothetical protein
MGSIPQDEETITLQHISVSIPIVMCRQTMSRAGSAPPAEYDGDDPSQQEDHTMRPPRWVLWWRAHAWVVRVAILVIASPPLWVELLGLHSPAFTGVMCRITFVILLMGKHSTLVRVMLSLT